MNPPYYIVSDNHFFMKNTSEENDRRKKLFKVFEKIREKNEGTLIIGTFILFFSTNASTICSFVGKRFEISYLSTKKSY